MKFWLFCLQLFLVVCTAKAKDIRIGVLRNHDVQHIDFAYYQGSYKIIADGEEKGSLLPNEFVSIRKAGNKVRLLKGVVTIGVFDSIVLQPFLSNSAIRLRPRQPILREVKYQDKFAIFSGRKGLTIVNIVSFQHYLEGVIESEGGGGKPLEYYKAQSVISRTYALKHLGKHRKEGFNLCSEVHCQAYHQKLTYTDEIKLAVAATAGIFMVDSTGNNVIETFFYANCGGETSRADYVWREHISYLQPVIDTFCIHTDQAKWEKRISKIKWRRFLINNYFYPITDSLYASQIYNFEQIHRKAFFVDPALGIPLRDLRYHFGLRSTFFSCHEEGEEVVLKGRGYGHGVGLCQEGAMEMARQGYDYKRILSHYYKEVHFKQFFEDILFNQAPNGMFDQVDY